MIKKTSKGYTVVAKSGRKMGTYPTKTEATHRMRQVEWFKHHPKK